MLFLSDLTAFSARIQGPVYVFYGKIPRYLWVIEAAN